METFTFQNHKISYLQKGHGPPLIMIHNGGNDHRIWDYQIDYFKQYFEIFAIDLLGYGNSDKPCINYSLDFYTSLLDHFIQIKKLDQVSLLGHCIGSAISLSYALANPGNVRYIVLFNIATVKTLLAGDLGQLYQWVQSSVLVRQSLKYISGILSLPRWVHELSIKMQYGIEPENDKSFTDHLIKKYQDPHQFSVLYHLLLNFQSFEILDTIVKPAFFPPTFIIWGAQNHILPLQGGRIFAENFKPDHFQVFPKGGHMVMRDCAQWVNQSLFNFFHQFKRRTI